jgi:hypothetical protein
MRYFALSLLLALTAYAQLPVMNMTTSLSCPGNILMINTTSSNGIPPAGMELRLVLYEPYYGFRGLTHTDSQGRASIELSRAGLYRIYPNTRDYDSPDYFEFPYPELCPPPPQARIFVELERDCDRKTVKVSVTSGGEPLENAFVTAGDWSSLTGPTGNVSFHFTEGWTLITAEKKGYANQSISVLLSCAECQTDDDCPADRYCYDGNCTLLNGTCGYAANHTWVKFGCCSDSDCGNSSICTNNTCMLLPPPPPENETPKNESVPAAPQEQPKGGACASAILAALLLVHLFTRNSGL